MKSLGFEDLEGEIASVRRAHSVGRVDRIDSGTLKVAGLSAVAGLGDLVKVESADGQQINGEILLLDQQFVTVLPDSVTDRLQIGDKVILLGGGQIAPHESWLGRVIDPYGKPLDGSPILSGTTQIALRGEPTIATQRRPLGARMETGMAVFNTLLPVVRGQRIGLFAGSGVGKSTLLAKFALGLQADIVVIAMIGERGREVREFIERVLGPKGMKSAVIVAATSDRSPLARRRCAWTAMAVAEYFRDLGNQVLFMADSITRFAEAHREIALAAGESGSLRGFPPSTAHLITSLSERAGPGAGHAGDITAVFSVLVAGSDMEEPIADILRGVLDGHVVLDREIAHRGRYPAIDLLRSVSRALPQAATQAENDLILSARQMLGTFERNEMMIRAGLYAKGSDEKIDSAIENWPKLDEFLARDEPVDTAASFEGLAACLVGSQPNP